MGLRTIFAEILPEMFEQIGEDATYKPSGGTSIDCKIFINFESSDMPLGLDGQFTGQTVSIEALLSDDAGIGIGTSVPGKGDEFTYNGTTYTVKREISNDGQACKLAVT